MADQLCTTAQVKARLRITDATDDTLISELIDELSDWLQHETGRKLVADASQTYYFDTRAGYVLHIPRGLRTVTSLGVALTAQPDSGGTYTTVAATDYLLRPKVQDAAGGWPFTEIWISRGTLAGTITRFATVQNGAKIVGDFGFATTPPDIQGVAIDAVVAAYQSRENGVSGVIGADDGAIAPWASFFGRGSPQRRTVDRYRWFAV